MGGPTTAATGPTIAPKSGADLAPTKTDPKSDVPEQCRAITDSEKQMHCAIDANNRDTFATHFSYDPAAHIWDGALAYHPSLRGIGVDMEGAGNDKLGGPGGKAGGQIGVSFTGALTPKVAITLGGSIGAGYEDAGAIKYVTGQLSSLALVRYTPNDKMSFHLSAKANLRATGSWNEKKADSDIQLGKDVGAKLSADLNAAASTFQSGVSADLQGLSPDAQARLQAALAPILQQFASGLTGVLAGAMLNPGGAQTQANNLLQTTETQILQAVNTALGGAAADFEVKMRARVSDFKASLSTAFSSAVASAQTAQNPAGGSFGANLEVRAGASFHLPLGQSPFYIKTGIDAYIQQPLIGNDTHTVMASEHNPTLQTFGIQPTVGIGFKPKISTAFVEIAVTPDFSLSGGHANKLQIPLTANAGLRF